jgi:hypothetical protein
MKQKLSKEKKYKETTKLFHMQKERLLLILELCLLKKVCEFLVCM